MSNANPNVFRTVAALVVSIVLVAGAAWLFFNRQFVLDTATNWSFEPSSEIVSISERAGLTDDGKFMFYATRPAVLDSESFNRECPRQEAASPILGCYTSADRIFMFNVSDPQLDGMKEVTAAHEILHAVWQRMTQEEQEHIIPLLQQAYESNQTDALKTRMEYYQRTEADQVDNELHSIVGTEVANLSDELEAYYAKYFDRAAVLALHGQYNGVYTQLAGRANELYAEMERLGASIDSSSSAYNAAAESFSADVTSFNNRANSDGFASMAQFNSERAALVARSAQLERDRASINTSIETYNRYYNEYNALNDQLQVLNDGMDSYRSIDEAPSV